MLAAALAACGPAPQDAAVDQDTDAAAAAHALAARITALEARVDRAASIDAIKRLQAAYGFYLEEGLWDQAADLFAEDGTIEIGLDGVYDGRERVRAYLYAMGGGRSVLPAGRLNEHLQVMPVVTLAADGLTAKARWREILLVGVYGEDGAWGEGPMEVDYVQENGVWKIRALHWYESLLAPYEGGWRTNEDPSGGVHISRELPPDRPPSVAYETWPGVYLPPFHFPNPGLAPAAAEAASAPVGVGDSLTAPPTATALARAASVLDREVAVLEAESAVENLQRTFGYYIDESLWSEAAALFSEDGTIELGNQGVYVGPERVLAFLRTLGDEFPRDGRLYDHMQIQPVVHVAPDAQSAKARWKLFSQTAEHGVYADWGVGIYENEYVLEGGVWKISKLRLYPTMTTPYELGWATLNKPAPGPSATTPPDRPPTAEVRVFPAGFTAPFHYDHPVFGRPVWFDEPADFVTAPDADVGLTDVEATLDVLETRVTRVEDYDALENLNSAYGYYLAANAWDDFTDLFAEDGTIEIALRGVYVGKPSIRRSMDLYGTPGERDGQLHNHMQFQPVIHVSEDGRTAHVRSRALSIMGEYQRYATWMGGVYENTFTKGEDGVWRYQTDRQFNTYFTNYDQGWATMAQGRPPGVSETNPPDRPPTSPFDLYPTAFLVPFHYPNPVTGRDVVVPGGE
jgi:hypothetical protein